MAADEAIVVRTAQAGDVEVVVSVLREAHTWLVERDLALWSLSDLTVEALFPDVEANHYLLAFVADEAVGTARLTLDDALFWPDATTNEAMYLHRLAVRRAHAGTGVTRALVATACQRAVASGCTFLRLDCRADRPRLVNLYKTFGFVFHSERWVAGSRSVRFQRPLADPLA